MRHSRRTALSMFASLAGASILTACGFRLRGAEQTRLPFKTIYLAFPDNSPLGVELRRYIRASGGTEIVADRKAAEARSKASSGKSSSGGTSDSTSASSSGKKGGSSIGSASSGRSSGGISSSGSSSVS